MRAARSSVIVAIGLALSAGSLLGRAQVPASVSRVATRQASARAKLSLDQAVRLAQRRFRARVVRAETQTQGDRTIYLLRMLDGAGRVFAVRVDASSGAFL
ncbi:MAG: PepSY domain-containing protein [Steroidobacteraceae bacterium]